MRIAITLGILLIVANLAFLDYQLVRQIFVKGKESSNGFNVVSIKESTSSAIVPTSQIVDSCYPYSCIDLIREATASLSTKTVASEKPAKTSSATAAREFYVPFGSGETKSDQWEDVPGLQAYIDSTKYGKIKTATFEATMRIPAANGRVYAQLFNVTDKHPVWFSEVSMEGNTPALLVSQPITLDPGNKLYKVQMKTTLKYQSILDLARVHIITE